LRPLLSLLVLIAIVVSGLLLLKHLGLLRTGAGRWPFYVRKPLSQPEHIVLAQVQVSRVLGVRKGLNFHEWNNRINRLGYDFVVCRKDSTVIAAIELDDKTHESTSRARTDDKKNRAAADAGLRLVRWNVRMLPSEEAIRAELLQPALVGAAG